MMTNETKSKATDPDGDGAFLQQAKILRDAPSSKDDFEGNGHQRSARALAGAVEQMANRDGAIGLEGRWGSGKSSVIELAETELRELNARKKDADEIHHHLMCYDLWAHQSDIFRRSFLEELLQWCANTKKSKSKRAKALLSEAEVKKFRDKIRDRRKTVTYEVDRSFSLLGMLFVGFAPLLPVLVAWLSPLSFSTAVDPESSQLGFKAGWGFPFAVALTASIYIALAIRILGTRFGKSDDSDTKRTWGQAFASTASVFKQEVEDRTETQHIRDEDPTSLEFQKLFRQILAKAQGTNHRFVFVFDNIDRLPTDQIIDRWAEIRSVFAIGDPEGNKSETSVTAIVPYDAELIRKATAEPETVVIKGEMPEIQPKQRQENEAEGNELIAKTFDITVRVAPPVDTDWEQFFYSKLAEAFGSIDDEHAILNETNRFRLFKLFDEYKRVANSYPTPRQIISYINSVGTLWNQWRSEIPIESMALYVLFRPQIEKNPQSIVQPMVIDPRYIRVIDQSEWQTHLAALAFNVDPEKAAQVLLGPKISEALLAGFTKRLEEYSEYPIFENALCNEVSSRSLIWCQNDASTFSNVIEAISALELDSEASNLCWRNLVEPLQQLRQLREPPSESHHALAKLINAPHGKSRALIARQLSSWASNAALEDEAKTIAAGESWFHFFEAIVLELIQTMEAGDVQSFVENTRYSAGEDFALGVAIASAYSGSIEFSDFKNEVNQKSMDSKLTDLTAENPDIVERVIKKKKSAASSGGMLAVANRVGKELRAKKQASSKSIEAYGSLLVALERQNSEVQQLIGGLSDDGTLAWHRHEAEKSGDAKAAAFMHFLIMLTKTKAQVDASKPTNHPQLGEMSAAWQSLDEAYSNYERNEAYDAEIATLVSQHGKTVQWAQAAIDKSSPAIYRRTFISVVENERLGTISDTGELLKIYPGTSQLLDDDQRRNYLNKLAILSRDFAKYYRDETLLALPVTLLSDAHKFGVKGFEDISKDTRDRFGQFTEEDWSALLRDDENGLRILDHQITTENYEVPIASFRPAILDLMKETLAEEYTVPFEEELYSTLPVSVPNASKSRIEKDFVNSLSGVVVTYNGAHAFVDTFTDFAMELDFAQNRDVLFRQLILPLIESKTDTRSGFMTERLDEIGKESLSLKKAPREQIENAIKDVYSSGDEAERKWAEELRTAFQFPEFIDDEDEPIDDVSGD